MEVRRSYIKQGEQDIEKITYATDIPEIDACPYCTCEQFTYTIEEFELNFQGKIIIDPRLTSVKCLYPKCIAYNQDAVDAVDAEFGDIELTFKLKEKE